MDAWTQVSMHVCVDSRGWRWWWQLVGRLGAAAPPFVVNASRHDCRTLWGMSRVLCGGQASANACLAGVWHMEGMGLTSGSASGRGR